MRSHARTAVVLIVAAALLALFLYKVDLRGVVSQILHADVEWLLSVDPADLQFPAEPGGRMTYRSITVDGNEVEFTEGFTDLHTRIYEEVLAGRGFGIAEARPSIELAYRIRTAALDPSPARLHPFLNPR